MTTWHKAATVGREGYRIHWRALLFTFSILLVALYAYVFAGRAGATVTILPRSTIQQTAPPSALTLWLPLVMHDYHAATVTSPNGKLRLQFFVGATRADPALSYTVAYQTEPLLLPSPLGLELPADETPLGPFVLTHLQVNTVDQRYPMPFGEVAEQHDQYNELVAHLHETGALQREMQIIFRAYDAGIALRYLIPSQSAWPTVTIAAEHTQFVFPADHLAYVQYGTEGNYQPQSLSVIDGRSENPLTIVRSDGIHLALTEAQVENYPRMLLARHARQPQTLVTSLVGPAQSSTPYQTPWRVLMVAPSSAALPLQNGLLYNLSPASVITDTSWIHPGKVIRSGLSTAAARQVIDFAATHGIEYIEFDVGWYGLGYDHEFDPNSDATQVIAAIDMPQVLAYAAQQGRGLILYVNRVALERQLDTLLPLYAGWGVKGIKFGFMDGRSQAGINFIHQAVRQAAHYHLIVDAHDNYRPSGLSRTYPNLLTQEGVRGNEHFAGADNNVTRPFTRFLAGAADFTFPYYVDQLTVTRAHQLGAMVAFFSPLQFVFWYDSPLDYQGEQEVAFIGGLPTVWDETVVVDGQIGSFVSVARRKGRAWFVGALTNSQPRVVTIPLTFLEPDQRYLVYHYGDNTPTSVALWAELITATDTINAALLPSGGHALRIVPLD